MAGFGLFGQAPGYQAFGASSAAPPELSLDQLYQPQPAPQFPEMPQFASSAGDLPEEERRRLKLALLAQLAQGLAGGDIAGGLAQAAGGTLSAEQQAIEGQRARQGQEYDMALRGSQQEHAVRQSEMANESSRRQAMALQGMYQRIVDADPGLADQAYAAAQQGNMSALQKIAELIPTRAAFRERGINPDDEIGRMVGEEQAKGEVELGLMPRELDLEMQAKLAEEQAKKAGGLGSYYMDPLRAEQIRASTEASRASAGRAGREFAPWIKEGGDGLYFINPNQLDPETGVPSPRRLDIPAKPSGRLVTSPFQAPYIVDMNSGQARGVSGIDPDTGGIAQPKSAAEVFSAIEGQLGRPLSREAREAVILDLREGKSVQQMIQELQGEGLLK